MQKLYFLIAWISLGARFCAHPVPALAAPLPAISAQEAESRLNRLPKTLDVLEAPAEKPQPKKGLCTESEQSFKFKDPVTQKPWDVRLRLYFTHKTEIPTAWILAFPTEAHAGLLDKYLSTRFCDAGISALVVETNFSSPTEPENKTPPPIEIYDQENTRVIVLTRFLVDRYIKDPRFSPTRIGVFGYGLGGVRAALAHTTNPKIQAAWIAATAGNLPAILAHSEHSETTQLRERRMEAFGLKTAAQYELLLRQVIEYDPVYFAHRKPRSSVKMLVGLSDTQMPNRNQIELLDAFGAGSTDRSFSLIEISAGYAGTLLQLPVRFVSSILDFFEARI